MTVAPEVFMNIFLNQNDVKTLLIYQYNDKLRKTKKSIRVLYRVYHRKIPKIFCLTKTVNVIKLNRDHNPKIDFEIMKEAQRR